MAFEWLDNLLGTPNGSSTGSSSIAGTANSIARAEHNHNTLTGTAIQAVTTVSGVSTVSHAIITPPLTDEEQQKLQDLHSEKNQWIKSERLKSFQKLPPHIRQDVVNEAIIAECVREMDSVYNERFERQDDIDELESKQHSHYASSSHNLIVPMTHAGHPTIFPNMNPNHGNMYKYGNLINEFTKDELMDAHAAATLEENLEE